MPTEHEKQAEKERVTRISGFRVGYHDFLAEVYLEWRPSSGATIGGRPGGTCSALTGRAEP
jgi:hypothetical protein